VKRRSRVLLLLLLSPLVLAACVAAFYGFENWRGLRSFEREVAAMKAEGLPTTFEEAFGPVPPAEEDVFQHPALVEEFARKDVDRLNGARHFQFPNLTSKWEGQPDLGKAADFRQMPEPARTQDEEAAVARELLAMLEPQSRRFDALAEAFRRPRWHWGADVESVVHRACMFKSLGLFAKLRATLRLAAGQPDLAAEDVHELIVLEKQFAAHPGSAVSHLILLELDRQTSRAIWEGVKRRAWTDEQLAGFQSELTPLDMGRAFMDLFPGEVAFAVVQSRAMLADPSLLEKAMEDVEAMERLANSDQERGWWEQLNEQFGKWVVKAMPLGWKMRPAAWRLAWMRELYVGMREAPLNRLAAARMACERVSEPELFRQQWEHMVDRATDGETRHSLLLTGIALERYRLKHGAVPDKLDALVPEFLPAVPLDACDGQPLRYRVLPDGSPHVWSLWPSGKDEDGLPNRNKTRNTIWTTGQIPGLTEKAYSER